MKDRVQNNKGESSVLSGVSKSAMQSSFWGFDGSRPDGDSSGGNLFERYLFPILAETNRSVYESKLFGIINFLFLIFQLIFGSLFLFVPKFVISNNIMILCKILFFGLIGNKEDIMSNYPIIFTIDFILFILLMTFIIDLAINHEQRKYVMLILRHIHGTSTLILIIPNFLLVFCTLTDLGEETNSTTIFDFLLSGLCLLYIIIQTNYVYVPLMMSPFIPDYSSLLWNPSRLTNFIMNLSIPLGFSQFFRTFDIIYFRIPPLILILISILLLRYLLFMHIQSNFNMAIFHGLPIALITGSCLYLMKLHEINLSDFYYFIIPWISLILGSILFYIINYFRTKNLIKILSLSSLPNGSRSNDSEKKEYYETLLIDSPDKAIMYLIIGLENNCELFLDWSLSKYIYSLYPNNNIVLIFLTWFVSFFPSEIHTLHSFITSLSRMIEPSLLEQILYYQLHRVHIFRQSSTSKEANSDFSKVKKLTDSCIHEFCKYWHSLAYPHGEFNIEIYPALKHIRLSTQAIWIETLDKYPNNSRFANEYSRFLLDGICNFKEALQWHHRANRIEQGLRHANDKLFLRFVSAFPFYLKKGIVDKRGTLKLSRLIAENNGESISSSTSTSQGFDSSANDDDSDESQFDPSEYESFLPHTQLRLALQSAIEPLQSPMLMKSFFSSSIRLFVSMVFVLIAIFLLYPVFDSQELVFNHLKRLNSFEQSFSSLSTITYWHWVSAYIPGGFNPTNLLNTLGSSAYLVDSYINFSSNMNYTVHNLSILTLNNYDEFSKYLLLNSPTEGTVEVSLTDLISYQYYDDVVCSHSDFMPTFISDSSSMDTVIRTSIARLLRLSRDNDTVRKKYNESTNFCEAYHYIWMTFDAFDLITQNLSTTYFNELTKINEGEDSDFLNSIVQDYISNPQKIILEETNETETEEEEEEEEEEESYVESLCNFFIAFAPFVVLLFTLPSIVYLSVGLVDEKMAFTGILSSFPHNEMVKASERIQKSLVGEKSNSVGAVVSRHSFPEWLINFTTAIIVIALIMTIALYTQSTNSELITSFEQFNLFMQLRNTLFDLGYSVQVLVFTNKLLNEGILGFASPSDYFNITQILERIDTNLLKFNLIESILNLGTDTISSSIGYNSDVDLIRFEELCTSISGSSSPIEFYRCISFERVISYYVEQIKSTVAAYEQLSPISTDFLYLTHLMSSRLSLGFDKLFKAYESNFTGLITTFHLIGLICFIGAIFCIILAYIIDIIVIKSINEQLCVFKSLMLRLNPIAFVAHPIAVSLIHGGAGGGDNTIISAAHAVFQTSHDEMILLNEDMIIESLNPSATIIFRFTPEQMLGQNLKFIIPLDNPSNSSLYYTIQLMKSGQCALIYETELIGLKDDGTNVPLKSTLLGFSSNGRIADSFALMCKDQTEETKQKLAVQEAKKQSEHLLHQILPKDIITRLNRGDKEITFSVASSTVIFIDIVQFSNYMATLTASQLMQNLSAVFTSFDEIVATLPLITKIKLIGDVYMAAGGLFHPNHPPKDHAIQMVKFSLKALESIEILNEQLNANLQVRIGINSGGPLIAGVLGTDKPLFDIIGDTINVAARLQSTCIPGLIQVSQNTYDLIVSENFYIEQRGEVELKGKGKQMTYLIHPEPINHEKADSNLFEVA